MKRLSQYIVGNVTITRSDANELQFRGTFNAKHPTQVILAILKVAKYLKWIDAPFTNFVLMNSESQTARAEGETGWEQHWLQKWIGDVDVSEAIWYENKKPYIQHPHRNNRGHVYINNKLIVHVCSTGNTDYVCIKKNQIIGAINDWFYRHNNALIPDNWQVLLPMLEVKKAEPFVEMNEDDFYKCDKLFEEYMENQLTKAGIYTFNLSEFIAKTGIPSKKMVWHYVTTRYESIDLTHTKLQINSATLHENDIEIEVS